MSQTDFYKIMGVSPEASQDEIKQAYRRLARQCHPDHNPEPEAEQRFKELAKAYDTLRDSRRRTQYDQQRQARARARAQGQRPYSEPPPKSKPKSKPDPKASTETDGEGVHIGEIFSSFLKATPFGKGRKDKESPQRRGEDHHAKILISLEDSYAGAVRTFEVNIPSLDKMGKLQHMARRLKVRIPKGILAGQQIRLNGQGVPASDRRERGDLYLEVQFESHPHFRIDGRDIHLTLPITPWEAALGTTLKAPTLGGAVELKIPEGAQSGQRLRLKGRGIPGEPGGDQIVELQIYTPSASDAKSRAFYRQMAATLPFNPRSHLE